MGEIAEALVVASILVHRNSDDAGMDCVDAILCLLPFFVFDILVPKRMGEEIETNQARPAFEQAAASC
jgi:hypothetical protein